MTTCTTCGQLITEIVTINGKPYGTTCALDVLGLEKFPAWFKGGDFNQSKKKYDNEMQSANERYQNAKNITKEYWSEWVRISKVYSYAHKTSNEWLLKFVESIQNQLGYYRLLTVDFETMEQAEKNWKEAYGDFPYLYSAPKKIESLSAKQIQILNKY